MIAFCSFSVYTWGFSGNSPSLYSFSHSHSPLLLSLSSSRRCLLLIPSSLLICLISFFFDLPHLLFLRSSSSPFSLIFLISFFFDLPHLFFLRYASSLFSSISLFFFFLNLLTCCRWYLGIQSKKDPAHVMTEVYKAMQALRYVIGTDLFIPNLFNFYYPKEDS